MRGESEPLRASGARWEGDVMPSIFFFPFETETFSHFHILPSKQHSRNTKEKNRFSFDFSFARLSIRNISNHMMLKYMCTRICSAAAGVTFYSND